MDIRSIRTKQRSRPYTLPPPVGGLNGRDAKADMAAKDAYELLNWFPGTATMDSRAGSTPFSTGLGAPVESLAVYRGGATPKMLGFAAGNVFNVTAGGAVGAAIASGRTGNHVVSAMFSNAGSQFLVGCTGADVPFNYDGTTWANSVMTGAGVVPAQLNFVSAFKGRLYFLQTGLLGFFYAAVGAIQGALSYFDLAQVAKLGGSVVAIASFSMVDSGIGPNDYLVFVTSEGEYIVYGGTDPSSATTWGLVGRYYGPAPIGRLCTVNVGSDIIFLTLDGALPFSEIRKTQDTDQERNAITSKLGTYLSDLNIYADVHGWQATLYPRGKSLILSVPLSGSIAGHYNQFVQNTTTNAWTRYDGWDGLCWTVFNRRLYFGTYDGRVMLADEGTDDDGEDIHLDCKQAYNSFEDGYGSGQATKHFHFARLTVASEGTPPVSGEISVDFIEDQPDYMSALDPGGGAVWDVATWDVAEWEVGEHTQYVTIALGKLGVVASLWLRASLNGTSLHWYSTKFIYEKSIGLLA